MSRCDTRHGAATVSDVNNPYRRLAADLPTECRDLHEVYFDTGVRVLPLDHWGAGCPFGYDQEDTRGIVAGESYNSDVKGDDA